LDRHHRKTIELLGSLAISDSRKPEDAAATLSFIRSPENAKRLSIDATRVALGGHSMGGWVTAETLAHDSNLLGAVIISAGDFGAIGLRAQQNREAVIAAMSGQQRIPCGVTGESMANELKDHGKDWSFKTLAPELIHRNLLVLYSNDFVRLIPWNSSKMSRPQVVRRSP